MGPAPSGAYRSSKGQTAKVAKKVHRGPKPGVGNQGKRRKHLPAAKEDEPAAGAAHESAGEHEEDDDEDKTGSELQQPPKKRKKGKVFVESQDDLLAMVRSITGELDEKKKEKVKRVKKQKAKPTEVKPEPKKKLSLEAAKAAVVSQRSKAKQERKEEDAVVEAVLASKDGGPSVERKRVSFA